MMRPSHARAWDRALVGIAVGALGVAAVMFSASAKASPVDDYVADNAHIVCSVLDDYPSVAGVEGVGLGIMDDGFSPQAAGEIIVRSVIGLCPGHLGEVRAFIAKYATAGTVRA